MTTTENFLDFWARAIPSLKIHPDDAATLNGNHHQLALDTLIGPWMGPLRTAPVVLLTLNGGIADGGAVERYEATLATSREWTARNLRGDLSLPNFATNPAGRKWTEGKLAQFGLSYETAASKVAFVNLIPYRSREGAKDMRMADRLPSSRLVKAWARDTLFPEAEAGKRVVVCLRSARPWGLDPTTPRRGQALFTPEVTRSGFIIHAERGEIGVVVREAVGLLRIAAE
jgi:hypothetical protein